MSGWKVKADSLFAEAMWFEAAIAYERVYYLADDPLERVYANLAKADAMKQQGEYSRAAGDLQRSLLFSGDLSLRLEVLCQLALCSYLDEDYPAAWSYLQQLTHLAEGTEVCWEAGLLEALLLSAQNSWDELADYLERWPEQKQADSFIESMQNNGQLVSYPDSITLEQYFSEHFLASAPQQYPDPDRARLLSTFLPGSGQVYAGRSGWGVLNAFSQLVSLGAFALMAYNGYYFAAVIAGLGPFQAFYFGGIRQAGAFAEEEKNSRLESFRAAVDSFLLDVTSQPSSN